MLFIYNFYTNVFCVLKDIVDILIYSKLNSNIKIEYIMFIVISAFLLVYSIILLGYFGNKIIISGSYITIRRATIGKTYTISRKSIVTSRPMVTPKASMFLL